MGYISLAFIVLLPLDGVDEIAEIFVFKRAFEFASTVVIVLLDGGKEWRLYLVDIEEPNCRKVVRFYFEEISHKLLILSFENDYIILLCPCNFLEDVFDLFMKFLSSFSSIDEQDLSLVS
jgi:hypothetical protein